LMIIDTTFGWIKGFKNGNWKSVRARWGIAGKIVELILISLLYILNWIFKVEFIVYIGLYYFIACEIASILENYTTINKNLPVGLIDVLKKLQFNIGTFLINGLKDFLEKTLYNKFENNLKGKQIDKNKNNKNIEETDENKLDNIK
ncbi:MAG: phage holin family protein, partial [Eubacteriales bacterium]|nr:phage holin family protein [Eubacteriales bacterium]